MNYLFHVLRVLHREAFSVRPAIFFSGITAASVVERFLPVYRHRLYLLPLIAAASFELVVVSAFCLAMIARFRRHLADLDITSLCNHFISRPEGVALMESLAFFVFPSALRHSLRHLDHDQTVATLVSMLSGTNKYPQAMIRQAQRLLRLYDPESYALVARVQL